MRPAPFVVLMCLAGCAALPDGSRIQRLEESDVALAPSLPAGEARSLTQLNAQILREQDAARRDEQARAEAQRHYDSRLYWGLQFGPGPWGRHRDRWLWRPYLGIDLWGPWP